MPIMGQRDTGRSINFQKPVEGRSLQTLLASSEQMLKPVETVDLNMRAAELHDNILEVLDLDKLHSTDDEEKRDLVEQAIRAYLTSSEAPEVGPQRDQVVGMVLDEILGFGPIQTLLDDDSIQEVMVNAPDQVYVESEGVLRRTAIRFRDDMHIRRVAERILSVIGRRVDESSPMVDARLQDGSRVNITVPPATPKHPSITVRKFRQDRMSLDDLMSVGTMDQRMAEFLGACTQHKFNILISGGTGTGKTTLLNAISALIPRAERIVSIEDPLELQLQQPHVVSMEARPPDMNGNHAITQRDMLRNTLRMRPDRIIVGEIRGSEAFEMLQAMNTGHEGSMSTVHSNTPRDALSRVENMVLMAGFDLPVKAIREQVASALHVLVHLDRFSDGVRRVTKITEVTGMEGDNVTLQDLFLFEVKGRGDNGEVLGRFRPTGLRPTFSQELELCGHALDAEMFLEGAI